MDKTIIKFVSAILAPVFLLVQLQPVLPVRQADIAVKFQKNLTANFLPSFRQFLQLESIAYADEPAFTEDYTFDGKTVHIEWHDAELELNEPELIATIRENIKKGLIDEGLLVNWRGEDLPAASTMMLEFIEDFGRYVYMGTFEDEEPFACGRTYGNLPIGVVAYQFSEVLAPAYDYWKDIVSEEDKIPVPNPGGVAVLFIDGCEVFIRQFVEGPNRTAYIALLRNEGKPDQEIADTCLRKESAMAWMIWKATNGRASRNFKPYHIIYTKDTYNAKGINFDTITGPETSIHYFFEVSVVNGAKTEIDSAAGAESDLTHALLGLYDAMVLDGMTDEAILDLFRQELSADYPQAVDEVETIIEGAVSYADTILAAVSGIIPEEYAEELVHGLIQSREPELQRRVDNGLISAEDKLAIENTQPFDYASWANKAAEDITLFKENAKYFTAAQIKKILNTGFRFAKVKTDL
ncbi:MAG: hypothetical protein U9R52_03775, partial [Candidatus Omnitrophota bacterium]|nr:hypothetical protein [Candidatus Omnitrophota bacterium]